MRRFVISVFSALSLLLALFVTPADPPAAASPVIDVQRITGADRYSVAALVSEGYPAGQAVTFVVGGQAYPDAVAAATRAGGINAPVLLVRENSVPSATAAALERLDSRRIVVVGGPSAVSEGVLDELQTYASSGVVERVHGGDRYATSASLAARYQQADRVYIAGGASYADALAGAALAGHQSAPMLLTRPDRLGAAAIQQLQRLNPTEVVILGGTNAVSAQVATQAASHITSGTVRRISGNDRYTTAAEVAKQFPQGAGTMYVASGDGYSDALVGSAIAARQGVPLVLTRTSSVPAATHSAIGHHSPGTIFALGGPAAITDATLRALAGETQPAPPGPDQALLGGYLGGPGETPDQRYRNTFGEWPDLASTYYQASGRSGGNINRAYERARMDRGTIPVLTVTSINGPYTMRQIGSGAADSWIDYWGTELAALGGEVWFTFDHEFEVKLNQGKWSPAPSMNDYVQAYNRFQQRVKAAAPNVKFMYWYGYADQQKINTIGSGINRPDIIALDPYVFSHHSPTTTFEAMAQPKLDWLRNRSWYDGQPIIFAEFAKDTRHGDANVAEFLTDLRPKMDSLGITGAIYFSRNQSSNNAIKGDLTSGPWPLARAALSASASGQ